MNKYLAQLDRLDLLNNKGFVEYVEKNIESFISSEVIIKEYLKNNELDFKKQHFCIVNPATTTSTRSLEFYLEKIYIDNDELYFSGAIRIPSQALRIDFEKEEVGIISSAIAEMIKGIEFLKTFDYTNEEEFKAWLPTVNKREWFYFFSHSIVLYNYDCYKKLRDGLLNYLNVDVEKIFKETCAMSFPFDKIEYYLAEPIPDIIDKEMNEKLVYKIQKKIESFKKKHFLDYVELDSCMAYNEYHTNPRSRNKKYIYKNEKIGIINVNVNGIGYETLDNLNNLNDKEFDELHISGKSIPFNDPELLGFETEALNGIYGNLQGTIRNEY